MKPADTFNTNAKRQDSSVFDYVREVEQAWRDFPAAKDNVIFLDLCKSPMLVYPGDEEGRQKAQEMVGSNRYLLSLIAEYIAQESSCCLPHTLGHRYLLLHTGKHAMNVLSKTATVAQEVAFVFDHELGHAIAPDGTYYAGNGCVPECIADAYAVMRHFQRFGADSTAVDALVDSRAYYMIFKKNRWDHFTSPVVAEVLERRFEIGWDTLTPQETVQMAQDIALKHVMERKTLLDLHDDFDRYEGHNDDIRAGDDKYLRTLAEEVMSMDVSCNLTKAGVAALAFCLDGNIPGLALNDVFWQELRAPLAEKHKALMQEKYLQVDPPAQLPSFVYRHAGGPSGRGWR